MKTIGVPTKQAGISFVKCALLIACVAVGRGDSKADSLESSNLVKQIEAGSQGLVEYDKSGKVISLHIPSRYHDERNIKLVSEIASLRELYFTGNSGSNAVPLTPTVIEHVTRMTNLKTLSFACFSNRLKAGVLDQVSKMKQLEELNLNYAEAPEGEYWGLTNLTNLTKLQITWTTNFGDAELQALTNLTKLRELDLVDTSVTPRGTNVLKNMRSLTNVYFHVREYRTNQSQSERRP